MWPASAYVAVFLPCAFFALRAHLTLRPLPAIAHTHLPQATKLRKQLAASEAQVLRLQAEGGTARLERAYMVAERQLLVDQVRLRCRHGACLACPLLDPHAPQFSSPSHLLPPHLPMSCHQMRQLALLLSAESQQGEALGRGAAASVPAALHAGLEAAQQRVREAWAQLPLTSSLRALAAPCELAQDVQAVCAETVAALQRQGRVAAGAAVRAAEAERSAQALAEQLHAAQQAVHAAQQQAASADRQRAKQHAAAETARDEAQRCAAQAQALGSQLRDASNGLQALHARLCDSECERQRLQEELLRAAGALKDAGEGAAAEAAAASRQLRELQQQHVALAEELQEERRGMGTALEAAEQQLVALVSERDAAGEQLAQLAEELERVRGEVQEVRRERQVLNDALAAATEQAAESGDAEAASRAEGAQLQQRLAQALERAEVAEAAGEAQQAEASQLACEQAEVIDELTIELCRARKALSTARAAQQAAEQRAERLEEEQQAAEQRASAAEAGAEGERGRAAELSSTVDRLQFQLQQAVCQAHESAADLQSIHEEVVGWQSGKQQLLLSRAGSPGGWSCQRSRC